MTPVKKDNTFQLVWYEVFIYTSIMLLLFITRAQHAVKIRIQSNVFFHRGFVNEWLLGEAGGMADMKGSRSKEEEGKCGFDLEFRLKIHQDLLNRCICQAGGSTQSGLYNHILFGCIRAQVFVCVFIFSCTCMAVHVCFKGKNKSIFITSYVVISCELVDSKRVFVKNLLSHIYMHT